MNVKKVFIDTNVFVYAKLETPKDAEKHLTAISFLADIEHEVFISVQVINEFSNVLLRHGIEDKIIRQSVKEMADACQISPLTLKTVDEAWRIRGNYHFSYWDSLIIASALENRCTVLYTEDLQHTQIIDNCLQIINPFLKP